MSQTQYLTRAEAPDYLKQNFGLRYAKSTLAKLATLGGGPSFYKASRTVLYATSDLDEWAKAKMGEKRTSTSSYQK